MSSVASEEGRRSAKWVLRRQTIIDVSAHIFAQQGYHATGTMQLCAANDLGKGALYHYIGSKEELLAAIHDRVMDEVMLGAERVLEVGGTPSQQLGMMGEELLDVIHDYPDHVAVFLHDFRALTGPRAERFRVRRREFERKIEAIIDAGIRSGEFRRIDPWFVTRAWLGMHNYTYLWLKPGGRLTARSAAKTFAEIFMRGITEPGSQNVP